jgi:hypothetical protein
MLFCRRKAHQEVRKGRPSQAANRHDDVVPKPVTDVGRAPRVEECDSRLTRPPLLEANFEAVRPEVRNEKARRSAYPGASGLAEARSSGDVGSKGAGASTAHSPPGRCGARATRRPDGLGLSFARSAPLPRRCTARSLAIALISCAARVTATSAAARRRWPRSGRAGRALWGRVRSPRARPRMNRAHRACRARP